MLSHYHILLTFPLLVFSQSSIYTPIPTSTLSTQAQVTAFVQSSPVFNGTVMINSTDLDTINLNGLTRVAGSLLITNAASIKTLQSDTLSSVSGSFILRDLPGLTNVSLPALSTVGYLTWQNLPLLTTAVLAPEISSISGLSMVETNVSAIPNITVPVMRGYINLQDNPNIKSVSLPSVLSLDGLFIENHIAQTLVSVSLPNLTNASTFSLSNVSSLSIPALQSLDSQILLYYTTLTNFSAPSLTDLSLAGFYSLNNPLLTTIEMPVLRTVRELGVSSNVTTLYTPQLQRAQAIELTSPITNLTFAPNIFVNQTLTMQLSSNFDCNAFATGTGAPNVTQTFQCSSNANSYYHSSTPSGLSTGAKAGIGAGVAVVVILLLAEGWYLCWRAGRKERVRRGEKFRAGSGETGEETGGETVGERRTGGGFFRRFGMRGKRM